MLTEHSPVTVGSVAKLGTGALASFTVTVKLAVELFPALSVAMQVTMVEPNGKVEPDAWSQLTGTGVVQLSVATGVE